MTNHMAEVAKILGLELDEVFFFKGCSGCYTYCSKTYLKFTGNGLKESVNRTSWHSAAAWVWKGLITGALKITKLPWKSSNGDTYWIPTVSDGGKFAFWSSWSNRDKDRYRYEHGLIFKTQEEAIELAEKMLAMAKEERNNG